MKNTQTMRKAGMCSPWIYKFRKSQLLNSPQPLKSFSFNNLPEQIGNPLFPELDQIVQRVTYPLQLH